MQSSSNTLRQVGMRIRQKAIIYRICPRANTAPPAIKRTFSTPSATVQATSPASSTQCAATPFCRQPRKATSTAMDVAAHLQAMPRARLWPGAVLIR